MFFRTKKIKKSTVLQLVKNMRDKRGKVSQKIVVSLGNLPVPNRERKEIAQEIENRLAGHQSLFPLKPAVSKWSDIIMKKIDEPKLMAARYPTDNISGDEEIADGVLIDRVEHENETDLGTVLVLKTAWERLGVGDFLRVSGFSESQINAAAASVFNRLADPVSEHEMPLWCSTVSLDELFEDRLGVSGDDRFYRISDTLLNVRHGLEKHLREKEKNLFNLSSSIILYDLTNSYFEGECRRNPKAKRGHSKEKRDDCPLLSLGLVLDSLGFIIGHEVLEGNRNDCKTLVDMVRVLGRHGDIPSSRPAIVVDGGIATAENLDYLRANGYEYVVAGKRQGRAEFYEDFCDHDSFSIIRGRDAKKPVFVKRTMKDGELIILCRSENRKEKEDAILSRTEEKFLEEISSFSERLKRPRSKLRHPEAVQRSIGRLQQKYSRAAKYYTVLYESGNLTWTRLSSYGDNTSLHGCYFLRSSLTDLADEDVWRMYVSLTRVEEAFRSMKTELGLRPFRHHREDRCEAHAWITVLAYHLQRWIEHSLELSGCPTTWNSLKMLLQTHCYSTMIIPSKDGVIRKIRKAGKPDERQRTIYHKLNVEYRNLPVRKSEKMKFL
ncbi:MAG: IS1634 family transposase [Lentisphaerae bacterium]|nr:IS1634 family transposase [Lentisphaerota bacterium]